MNPWEEMNAADMRREQVRRGLKSITGMILFVAIATTVAYAPRLYVKAKAEFDLIERH